MVLKNNLMKRFESEEAASYRRKKNRIDDSTVAPYWARDADKGLRALILSERAYRNYRAGVKPRVTTLKQRPHKEYHCSTKEETSVRVNSSRDISDGAVSAKEFNNALDAEHNDITSEDMCQRRPKRFKSYNNFKVVSGDKFTLKLNGRVDSYIDGNTLTGPVRVGHTEIKKGAENRAENNSPAKEISMYDVLKNKLRILCFRNSLLKI